MYKRRVHINQNAQVSLGGSRYELLVGQEITLDFGNYGQFRRLVIAGLCDLRRTVFASS